MLHDANRRRATVVQPGHSCGALLIRHTRGTKAGTGRGRQPAGSCSARWIWHLGRRLSCFGTSRRYLL